MEAVIGDVSGWARADAEWLGDQEKEWLTEPSDGDAPPINWLFKPSRRTELLGQGGVKRRTFTWFDAQSELIAHQLAVLVGIPSASIRMVRRGERVGCLSRSVRAPEEDLQSGDVFLAGMAGDKYVPNTERAKNRTGHHLAAIGDVLEGLEGPHGSKAASAREVFAGYLVFDAWIGNTDRHAENWALTVHGRTARLAASFDHGSALASGRSEPFLERSDPCEFARRAMARKFDQGKNVTLVELAHDAMDRWGGPWIDALRGVGAAQEQLVVDGVPGLSDLRRTLIRRVLEENRRRLLET